MIILFKKLKKSILLCVLVCVAFSSEFLYSQQLPVSVPKNIIIMIGDGMGFNHLLATEYFLHGSSDSSILRTGGFTQLAMATYPAVVEKSPEKVYASGYNADAVNKNPKVINKGFTDSGAAATAMATGKKTSKGTIGMCINGDTLFNLVELSKHLGKSAGVVTSVPISHATPAAFVTHNASRSNYQEIARDMILNSKLDVLMGCGNPDWNNKGEYQRMNAKYVGGDDVWAQLKNNESQTVFAIGNQQYILGDIDRDNKPDPWLLVQDSAAFAELQYEKPPKRVLGIPKVYSTLQQERMIFDETTLPYETPLNKNVPSLSLMTSAALNVLTSNNKEGFFLMVEGGAIDWASHENQSHRMIEETHDFINSVQVVIDWVNNNSKWSETLLIVTADHETGFLWAEGGNEKHNKIVNNGKGNLPGMKWYSGDHTNTLVPFFVKGAGSLLFNLFADEYDPNYGYYLQNTEIAHSVFLMWGKFEE